LYGRYRKNGLSGSDAACAVSQRIAVSVKSSLQ